MAKSRTTLETEKLFGFLSVIKPPGITAHDAVAMVRKASGVKQVGHGGTLDPLAEGVLPIAIGKATRLLRFLTGDKVYRAEIQLGTTTDTDDLEGKVIAQCDEIPEYEKISAALENFRGQVDQLPPLYSAVHVGGKRLYELARQGVDADSIAIPERTVFVHDLQVLGYERPKLTLRITCSAGTYIRSIARDLGVYLGCGGTLSKLLREKAGPFDLTDSHTLAAIAEAGANRELGQLLVVPQAVLTLAQVEVDAHQKTLLQHGQPILVAQNSTAESVSAEAYLQTVCDGALVAICRTIEVVDSFVRIQPEVVISHGEANS